MLDPRPAKLRSQRDISLWRIPLTLSLAAFALFGATLIRDILDLPLSHSVRTNGTKTAQAAV
jgi:hypothetical protein